MRIRAGIDKTLMIIKAVVDILIALVRAIGGKRRRLDRRE